MRFFAASAIALLYATSTLAVPWIGKVPPPYTPLKTAKAASTLSISDNVYRTDRVNYEVHMGPKPFQSWIQQTLDFAYVKPLFDQVQKMIKKPLTSRGEAHITLITPPEYDQVLKPAGITMDDLNKLAVKMWIQKAEFKVKCLGRARVPLKYPTEADEVYFIVVESDDLLKIREEIQKMYISRGGEPSLFAAHAFWPHVTLGYTFRDMFLGDGVWKDTNACWADLRVYQNWNKPRNAHASNSVESEEEEEEEKEDDDEEEE